MFRIKYRKTTNASPVNSTVHKKTRQASILPVLFKAFGPSFLFGSTLKLSSDLFLFISPQILRLIIGFVETPVNNLGVDQKFGNESAVSNSTLINVGREPLWHGIFFAFSMFAVTAFQTIFKTHHLHRMSIVGQRIRTALIGAIFKKSLVLSNSVRKESTVGEIVNLMAVDAQRFMDLTENINIIWSAPLQIGLALYFLWQLLGLSVLAGE